MNRSSIFAAVRQPKSAAVAGLVFGTILAGVLVLFHDASPALVADAGTWADDEERREAVSRALNLIPFAGIAFLWFVAVIRANWLPRGSLLRDRVPRLGNAVRRHAVAAAAVMKGALALTEAGVGLPSETLAFGWALATALLGIVRRSHGRGLRHLGRDHGDQHRHHPALAGDPRIPDRDPAAP